MEHPTSVFHTNVLGTCTVLEAARTSPTVRSIVAASSSSVYGSSSTAPFDESQICDKPISPYAATKRANELYAHALHHLHQTPITMLRFFTVYGPRGRPDMAAFKFIHKISQGETIERFGDGSQIREFTFISDIVDGVLKAIDKPNGFQVVNLGGGATYTLAEFIGVIEKGVGREALVRELPPQPGDVAVTSASQKKASEVLGFQPQIGLEEGISRTVEWYRGSFFCSAGVEGGSV